MLDLDVSRSRQVSNGAGEALFAGMTGQNSVRRGLVHFDLSALPSNAVVNSASVSMYSTKAPLTNYVFLHRALASWGEGTSNGFTTGGQGDTPTTNDVTWQHRFYDTVNWATPGGDFAATASARSATPVLTGDFAFASNAALVADVQGWINNPIANFGWAVLGAWPSSINQVETWRSLVSTPSFVESPVPNRQNSCPTQVFTVRKLLP